MAKKQNVENQSQLDIDSMTVDEIIVAYDNGLFGDVSIGSLQKVLGNKYAPFVRAIHLR